MSGRAGCRSVQCYGRRMVVLLFKAIDLDVRSFVRFSVGLLASGCSFVDSCPGLILGVAKNEREREQSITRWSGCLVMRSTVDSVWLA